MRRRGAVALGVAATVVAAVWVTAAPQRGSAGAEEGWHTAAAMPERRSYFASAEIGGEVYVAAGMVGGDGRYLPSLDAFDPAQNTWTRLPDMPGLARAAAGAALRGRLYVLGGQTPQGVTRRVWAYDPAARRWSRAPSLPAPRYNAAAASLGGRLYVAGGVAGVAPVRSVFVYDPATRRWSRGPSLPRPAHTLALVAHGRELWAIGGFDAAGDRLRAVWTYRPGDAGWRAGPRLAAPIAMVGAAAAGGRVFAVSERVFESWSPGRGWRLGPALAVPRHALGLYAAAGRLWAVGGCVVPALADSRVVESLGLPAA